MIDIKSVYKIVLISLVFGVIGYFIHPYFMKLSVMEMKDVNVVTLEKGSASNLSILMGIIFTFIPLFFFTSVKVLTIENQRHKIFILLSIILAGVIFWQFKLYSIQQHVMNLRAQTRGKIINYVFPQEHLNLEFYLFIGFFVGVMISGVILYRIRKK